MVYYNLEVCGLKCFAANVCGLKSPSKSEILLDQLAMGGPILDLSWLEMKVPIYKILLFVLQRQVTVLDML
jgi:hypothetical protein